MPPGVVPFPFGKCRVCRDRATGVHYGVATCEGCKGFFKRSTLRGDKYKCFFGGQCDISPQNRNRCKSCRFRRCLESGMAIDAVKMGRIPKLEKERALAEARMNVEEDINPQIISVTSTTRDVSMEKSDRSQQRIRVQTEQGAHSSRQMHGDVNMGEDEKLLLNHQIHIDSSNPDGYHNMRYDYSQFHPSMGPKDLSHASQQHQHQLHSAVPNSHAPQTTMQMCQQWVNSQSFSEGVQNPMLRNPVPSHSNQRQIGREGSYILQNPMESSHLPSMNRSSDFGDQGNLVEVKTEIPYRYDYAGTPLHMQAHSSHQSLIGDGTHQHMTNSTFRQSSQDFENDVLHSGTRVKQKGESMNNTSSTSGSMTFTNLDLKIGQHENSMPENTNVNTGEGAQHSDVCLSPPRTGYSPTVIKVLINKFMEANHSMEKEEKVENNPVSAMGEMKTESIDSGALQSDGEVITDGFVWKKFDTAKNLHQPVSPQHMIERKLMENADDFRSGDGESKSKTNSVAQRTESISSVPEENVWEDYKFLKAMVPDPIFGNLPLHVRNMETMKKLGQEGVLERLVEFPIDMIMSIADKIKNAKSDLKPINRHGMALGRESELIVQSTMVRLKQVAKVLLEPLWQKRCYVRQYWQGRQEQAKFTTTDPEEMDGIWATLMKSVGHFNEIIIGFCKNVPGFSKLNSKLKEFLVERVYFDIWMLNSYEFMVDDTSYMVMPDGRFYSRETMMYILKEERVKELLDVAGDLNSFHLTDLELMLLCVVQLTCPDNIPTEIGLDLEPLRILNLHYLDILANVISHNYGQKCSMKLVKIFQFLPKLTKLTNKLRKQVSSYVVDELPDDEKLEDIFHESDKVE